MIPKTWVKFVVGLFLIPFVWVLTETFATALGFSLHHGLLGKPGFLFFLGGIVLWGLLFWLLPRRWLLLPYVYGHECTHALWVKIFRGRVHEKFYVSAQGGHILADRINTWIALAPYFFPIYTLLVISIYALAKIITDVSDFEWVMFLLLGLTWAFHLTFTCSLIAQGQPDLHYSGTFFSMILIYGINLLLVTIFLLITVPYVNTMTFLEEFASNMETFLTTVKLILEQATVWLSWLYQYLRVLLQ